jgi:hypothetical protein
MSKFLLNLLLQISKALLNSKIQFLIQKFSFLTFGPADLAAHSAFGPTSPLASLPPQAETHPSQPTYPMRRSCLHGNKFSLLVRAFRAGRLSLISLSSGPRLSAPSLTSGRLSSPAPPPLPGHPAPPSSVPQVPPSRYHPAFIFPPLIPLLNPPSSSMALKPLTPALTPLATPPRRSPDPYKRRAPPPDRTSPSPSSLLSTLEPPSHRAPPPPVLHHHRPASMPPPELR